RFNKNLGMFHADVVGRHSERTKAEALARQLKLDLHTVAVEDQDSIDGMADVTRHYGHPFSYHPNSIPFLIVARLVRDNAVKAVLSGEGADETFIGYPWLLFDLRGRLLQVPGRLQTMGYRGLRALINRADGLDMRRDREEREQVV